MEPIDKFGNEIFPKTFTKMEKNARILLKNGYLESKKKPPNLFLKRNPQGIFYANMRGTKEIPIWENTRPLFHWRFWQNIPKWERRRLIKEELKSLFKSGCPCRLSFELHHNEDFENTSASIDEEKGLFDWDDGYCTICGKDFQDEGSYCSKKCEVDDILKMSPQCEACGKYILSDRKWKDITEYCPDKSQITHSIIDEHHINYKEDETVVLCRSCHIKIHKTSYRNDLKPTDKKLKQNKLENKTCSDCKKAFQPRNIKQVLCSLCLRKIRMQPKQKPIKRYRDWVNETYG